MIVVMTEHLRAALLEDIHPIAGQTFTEAGFDVTYFPKSVSEEELTKIATQNQVIGVRSGPPITENLIANAPELTGVGVFAIGTNHIAIDRAAESGLAVFSSPFENSRSVAELVMGKIFGLLRRLGEHNQSMHSGEWSKTSQDTYEVRGKTLGIYGYGNIGKQVSVLAEAIGMRVIFYDAYPQTEMGNARAVSREEMFAEADVITIHAAASKQTQNLITAAELESMKQGSYLINTARGDMVDEAALKEAIDSGHIAGAALDVHQQECKRKGDQFYSVFRGMGRVILSPHIGGSTLEAQKAAGRNTAAKLIRYILTGDSRGALTLPNLLPDRLNGYNRLLYIHRNEPGSLAVVTDALAENRLNIVSQKLNTNRGGPVGYAYVDADQIVPDAVLKAVRADKRTLRLRSINGVEL
jgi:D-3-phosphoglycerate dehydrogenase / 2-oxoglutarate reductase